MFKVKIIDATGTELADVTHAGHLPQRGDMVVIDMYTFVVTEVMYFITAGRIDVDPGQPRAAIVIIVVVIVIIIVVVVVVIVVVLG